MGWGGGGGGVRKVSRCWYVSVSVNDCVSVGWGGPCVCVCGWGGSER